MTKRRHGEGTIYTDKNGDTWVQLSIGPDGRRPRRKVPEGVDPVDYKRQLEEERSKGRDLSRKAETVEQMLDYSIETVRPQIAPGTLKSYRDRARHVSSRIGSMKIRDVATETIQRLANDLATDGLSPVYVRGILEQLSAAFQLVIPEKISYNPVNWKKLKLRKVVHQERRPVDDEVVLAIMAAADDVATLGRYARVGIAWWLAALLGLRRGEIAALSWRDVNWEKAELHIRQAYAPGEAGGYSLSLPKNKLTRVMPVGPRLLVRLRQHWEQQQAERRLKGVAWKEGGFIVCKEDGTPFDNLTLLDHYLRRLCLKAGLPHTTPHQLRHTVATIITEEGFSEVVVAAVLGHEKGNDVTRRYIHAREKAKRNAILAVEQHLFGAAAEAEKGAL